MSNDQCPAIRTALAGSGATHGALLDDFCDAIFAALSDGDAVEIGYGATASSAVEVRLGLDHKLFESFSGRFPAKTYG